MPRNISRNLVILLSALAVLVSMACSSNKKKSPTDPVDPEVPVETVTRTFRGELPQNEERCHFFTVSAAGSITLELTDLKPLSSLTVGMNIGRPADINPEICSVIGEDRSVRIFETILSANNPAGEYCTCIFDVGNIFPGEIVDYTLEVTHPDAGQP